MIGKGGGDGRWLWLWLWQLWCSRVVGGYCPTLQPAGLYNSKHYHGLETAFTATK